MYTFKKILNLIYHDIKNNSLLEVIKGVIMWISLITVSIIMSSLVLIFFLITYPIDKERHFLHKLAIYWGKIIIYLNPRWEFIIVGKENLAKKNEPVIYVANHQSQVDILALFFLSMNFRWLSKDSLFKIPLFGWAMSAIGYVPIKRGNRKSSERCMRISAAHLKNGTPMVFFPEGTRSENGQLGEFKNGAFRLAVSLGVPVVPITIDGCAELLPKGSIFPKKARVNIIVHKPIFSQNLSAKELLKKTKQTIAIGLENSKNFRDENDLKKVVQISSLT